MKMIDKIIVVVMIIKKMIRGILKKPFFKKSKGIQFIGKKVDISHMNHIIVGKNVKFEDYSEIHGLCDEDLIFGDNVTIGRNCMIRPSSYYGKQIGKGLVIGNNSSIGPHGYIGCSGKIVIGENVMFGPKCSLFAENHIFSDYNHAIKSQGVNRKGIIIEDDCWIGSNVTILDGVKIGKGTVIGAGTIITKDIPEYSIVIDRRNKKITKR